MQKILSLVITTFIFACLVGLTIGQFVKIPFLMDLQPARMPTPTPIPTEIELDCSLCSNNEHKNFYYHRLVLFGEDELKKPFVIKFQLSKKQISHNEYEHTYTTTLYIDGKTHEDYDFFKNSSTDTLAHKLFDKFTLTREGGQTTKEDYQFIANLGGKKYTVSIAGINGDFVIKDTNDYVRIMSQGYATLSFDNKTFTTQALVDKIISNDYTKSIFFEGRENLSHVTHSIAIWDQNNEFYLIDFTKTNSPELPYESHKWVIHKNREGFSTKIFDGNLNFQVDAKGMPANWIFDLPELDNSQITLSTKEFFEGKDDMGIIEGTIKSGVTSKRVKGYFIYINV
jgi:hypothetical protein